MLVNRDESLAHAVRVVFENSQARQNGFFSGPVAVVTFGSAQYEWKDEGINSHADPDGPPLGVMVTAGPQTTYTLPKASITVLRGRLEGLE